MRNLCLLIGVGTSRPASGTVVVGIVNSDVSGVHNKSLLNPY